MLLWSTGTSLQTAVDARALADSALLPWIAAAPLWMAVDIIIAVSCILIQIRSLFFMVYVC
jgi:hypothetical protein